MFLQTLDPVWNEEFLFRVSADCLLKVEPSYTKPPFCAGFTEAQPAFI